MRKNLFRKANQSLSVKSSIFNDNVYKYAQRSRKSKRKEKNEKDKSIKLSTDTLRLMISVCTRWIIFAWLCTCILYFNLISHQLHSLSLLFSKRRIWSSRKCLLKFANREYQWRRRWFDDCEFAKQSKHSRDRFASRICFSIGRNTSSHMLKEISSNLSFSLLSMSSEIDDDESVSCFNLFFYVNRSQEHHSTFEWCQFQRLVTAISFSLI